MAILASPAAVAAATHTSRAHTSQAQSPQPDPGKWQLGLDAPDQGGFAITKKVEVVRVHGKPHKKIQEFVKNLTYDASYVNDGFEGGGDCAGTVVVPGPIPITPWHTRYGEYWIVGSLKDMASNFPTAIAVSASLNGEPLSDTTVAMLFYKEDAPSKTQGQLREYEEDAGCVPPPLDFQHG